MKFYNFRDSSFEQYIAHDGVDTLFLNYFNGRFDSAEWADEDFNMEEWLKDPGPGGPEEWKPFRIYEQLFVKLCFAPGRNLDV